MNLVKKSMAGNIVFVIILIIQCAYMIYWGTQKSGYYVDEFFTYDNAHYISESTPKREKLYDADYMEYGKWFDVSELKSTLTVQKEESLINDSLLYNMKAVITKKSYMALLNYVETVFFAGELNWWSAISLNIVFYIVNQILMYAIVMKISGNRTAAFLSMALYGFCGMAVSMLVYVRFYMYVTMMVTLFTYIHVLMWYCNDCRKNLLGEVLSMLILYMSFRMSPISAIYGIGLILSFSVALLIKKRRHQAAYYAVPIIGAGAFYAIFMTNYVKIFLNPQKAFDNGLLGSASGSLIRNMLNLNFSEFINRAVEFTHTVCRFLYGHSIVLGIYGITIIILLAGYLLNRKKALDGKKQPKESCDMVIIILAALFVYAIGSIVFHLGSIRYNSFIFPQIAISVIMLIMLLVKNKKENRIVAVLLGIAIIGEIFFTSSIPRIENLYLEDRDGVAAIKECGGINSVVVDYGFNDRVMYECLAYTDENTKVMFASYGENDYEGADDTILLWQTVNQNFDVQDDLINAGYNSIEEIARTHESVVYMCRR